MDTPYIVVGSPHAIAPARPRFAVIGRCWAALLDWKLRVQIRVRLNNLSDHELQDIGIARGEIDYVASHRAVDPRSAVYPP
ncbi:hypothetical protein AS156_19615 [Bradyrhizobium macuxiense]|uniref:YjiS-like domain-containing protein n=1 Tax=Bradyrhizobium macuxiense TaxID=1755647 RepID=A0A120FIK2_9BRAD|nr:DUF1127 domain-containing protein [Bradyrhizobium macuxiense]KWV47644.1 hypothetical protein AS156_19615 [Bradyrhizobium macuxiense]